MITTEDVKKLAKLSRMEVSDEEIALLANQLDSILAYVGQITAATGDVQRIVPPFHNVMREDIATHTEGQYTDAILSNAPQKEDQYFKVKKILS